MLRTRKAIARLVLMTVPVVGVFAATPAASAQPARTNTTRMCPMEVDGRTVYVPVGTRFGMFVCGSNGQWKWGWLITE